MSVNNYISNQYLIELIEQFNSIITCVSKKLDRGISAIANQASVRPGLISTP
jgi:hypothetical protein